MWAKSHNYTHIFAFILYSNFWTPGSTTILCLYTWGGAQLGQGGGGGGGDIITQYGNMCPQKHLEENNVPVFIDNRITQ